MSDFVLAGGTWKVAEGRPKRLAKSRLHIQLFFFSLSKTKENQELGRSYRVNTFPRIREERAFSSDTLLSLDQAHIASTLGETDNPNPLQKMITINRFGGEIRPVNLVMGQRGGIGNIPDRERKSRVFDVTPYVTCRLSFADLWRCSPVKFGHV